MAQCDTYSSLTAYFRQGTKRSYEVDELDVTRIRLFQDNVGITLDHAGKPNQIGIFAI